MIMFPCKCDINIHIASKLIAQLINNNQVVNT
jgi:hypothetical protein